MADESQDQYNDNENGFSRRDFVKGAAAFTATAVANARAALAARQPEKPSQSGGSAAGPQIAKRELGKTGAQVSILGVGGYHLGSTKDQQ
jgi:uncharacterized protein